MHARELTEIAGSAPMRSFGSVRGLALWAAVSLASLTGCAGREVRDQARRGAEPPRPYVSDGCSVAPDLDVGACCEAHDLRYWRGGSCDERRSADAELAACIRARGHPLLAKLYFVGVRIGGAPLWPTPWRWGFGWPYGLGCYEREDRGEAPSQPPRTDSSEARSGSGSAGD